jgi:hypothetical protein
MHYLVIVAAVSNAFEISLGSKRLHTWLNVILPASLPFIETMLGVRVALADGGGDLGDDIDWLRTW